MSLSRLVIDGVTIEFIFINQYINYAAFVAARMRGTWHYDGTDVMIILHLGRRPLASMDLPHQLESVHPGIHDPYDPSGTLS
jgi:hypothetical protein